METSSVVIECPFGEDHEFPPNWKFGGADGLHPAADSRWKASNYTYWTADARPIFTTCVPLCDDQAIDEFTSVAQRFPKMNPMYLSVKRDGEKEVMFKLKYDKSTDTVYES